MREWKKEIIRVGDESSRSHARIVRAGNLVFISGVGGRDTSKDRSPELQEEVGYPLYFEQQVELIFQRLSELMKKAGTSLENIVHATVYVLNREDLWRFNRIAEKYWQNNPPTITGLIVSGFLRRVMQVEVDAIAIVPDS